MPLTVREVKSLAEDALGTLDALDSDERWPFADDGPEHETSRVAFSTLRETASVSTQLLDRELLPSLVRSLERLGPSDPATDGIGEDLRVGLKRVLSRFGLERPLDALKTSVFRNVRSALAFGLDPTTDEGKAALFELLHDVDGVVVGAARATLHSVGLAPWWEPGFSSDPTPQVSDTDEDDTVLGPVRAYAELAVALVGPAAPEEQKLIEALAALPEALRSNAAESLFRLTLDGKYESLASACLELPGGGRGLMRVVADRRRFNSAFSMLGRLVARTRGDCLLETANEILGRLQASDTSTWVSDEFHVRCALVLTQMWQPHWPLARVLAVLMRDDIANKAVPSFLGKCIAKSNNLSEYLPDLENSRVEGMRPPWSNCPRQVDLILASQPVAARRALADRALQSTNIESRGWALSLLLGELWDFELDGPRDQRAACLAEDARLRSVMLGDVRLIRRALQVFRPALVAGELSFDEAATVMLAVGVPTRGLHPYVGGGWAHSPVATRQRGQGSASLLDESYAKDLLEMRLWGGERASDPISHEEWTAFRATRSRTVETNPLTVHESNIVLPRTIEQFTHEDRIFVELVVARVLARTHAGPDNRMAEQAFGALLAFCRKEDLPVLERLIEVGRTKLLRAYGKTALAEIFNEELP